MRETGATGYIGTPSFLKALIDRSKEQGYDFRCDFKLKHALLTAEMLPPSLKQIFQQDYNMDVYQVYGTADLGVVAYECSQKSGMHIPEEMITEVLYLGTGDELY